MFIDLRNMTTIVQIYNAVYRQIYTHMLGSINAVFSDISPI